MTLAEAQPTTPGCLWCRDTGVINTGTAYEGRCHRCTAADARTATPDEDLSVYNGHDLQRHFDAEGVRYWQCAACGANTDSEPCPGRMQAEHDLDTHTRDPYDLALCDTCGEPWTVIGPARTPT